MANRYWVGGSGDWSDTAHWSSTSGGAGGASVPTSGDNAFFNASSSTAPFSVAAPPSTPASVGALSIKPAHEVSMTGRLSVYGVFSNNDKLITSDYLYLSLWGSGNHTLSEMSAASDKLYLSQYGAGVLSLGGAFHGYSLHIGGGTFVTNGHTINVATLAVSGHLGATPTVNFGNSVLNVRNFSTAANATVSASNASLNISPRTSSSLYSMTGDNVLGNVHFLGPGYARINGSNVFGSLTLDPGLTLTIETSGSSATTNTVTGSFTANGTSSKQIIIRSSTPGLQHVWRKTSGTVDAHYLDLKDSVAMGGATWNANSSVNSGNNSGWNFIGPVAPTASFTASPWSGRAPLTVQFTDTSAGSPTSWNWNFGDGTTSTQQNPSKTYSNPGMYTVSLNVQNSLGGSTTTRTVEATTTTIGVTGINANASATGSPTITTGGVSVSPGSAVSDTAATGSPTIQPGGVSIALTAGADGSGDDTGTPTITQSDPPPPPPTDWEAIGKEDEKVFVYKVYSPDGTFMSVWTDVKDDPQFTQHINTPGTTMTVQLARSPNTTKEVRANLLTEAGDPLTTEDGQRIQATYETNNNVGEDTDVDLNLNVDVYVHYGEYGYLLTQDGEPITTEDGERLLVASGAPMGVRVFSGFILDYESVYGEETGVTVTLASHGYELSNELIRNGETVNVNYTGQDHADIIKSILDTNPGRMSYDATSIQETGQNVSVKFQLNTKLEGIKSVFDQTPDGWYWFGNPADNLIYLRQRSTTPRHIFYKGKHIKSMRLKRTMEGLTNRVYFVGGEKVEGDPATTLFKKYEDAASQSQWRVGLERITDRRYTIDASAQNRSMKLINSFSQPVFTTPLTISSARYDLETIKLGDTVGFANFGNFVDSVVLQIVALTYTPTAVTLELGELLERQVDSVAELEDDLNNEQYQKLPDVPS